MSRFQGPGKKGSKWQTLIPKFNNSMIEFKMNLKEILEMKMEKNINSMEDEYDQLISDIENNILQIYRLSVDVYKFCIKFCFVSTFVCFIGMIGYPFGNLFGLLIPSKNDTKMMIIYGVLLIVIEIIFVYFYFKCHDIAHNLEHKAVCLFINNLGEWINNIEKNEAKININLIYPKQILDYKLIDHGKPLNIYICLNATESQLLIQNRTQIGNNTFVIYSLYGIHKLGSTKGTDFKNSTVQTPLLNA